MNNILSRIQRKFKPLTITGGLAIVRKIAARNGPETDKFDRPINLLVEYLGEDARVTDVTQQQINGWYKHIKQMENQKVAGKLLSPHTVNSYARLIRAYFNHLVKLEYLEKSPVRNLTIAKPPKILRKDIPVDDIEKMVKAAGRNARDKAIVLLLRDSGMRVGELISMTADGLHFEKQPGPDGKKRWSGWAQVYGQKMDKWRYVFFGHDAAKALKAYLETRPEVPLANVWLAYDGQALTPSGVYQMLERTAKLAGVKRFNPHAFRHAKTKELYAAGVPEPTIMAAMGHDDERVTRLYVQYEPAELLAILHGSGGSHVNGRSS